MKKISWEIVLAGLLFVGAATFLIIKNVQREDTNTEYAVTVEGYGDFEVDTDAQSTIVISMEQLQKLESLENLENLENLEGLENLEELRKLEKLEKLESLQELSKIKDIITKEAMVEVEAGLAAAVKEIEAELAKENITVSISNENLVISKDYSKLTEGEWSNVDAGVYAYTKKFDIRNLDYAELIMTFGHITVIGTDSDEGSLTLRASGKIKSGEDLQSKLMTLADISEEKVKFTIQPQNEVGYKKAIQLEATLKLPKSCDYKTVTDGGHIQIENISGVQDIVTDGGHIELSNLSGTINATTDGGHITGKTINGVSEFITNGGHLEIVNGQGKATLLTNGGHIKTKNYTGEVTAKTSGGNIDLKLPSFSAPIVAQTSAGNINVFLPTSSQANLVAKGTKTYIEKYFEITGDVKKNSIKGKINEGGNKLELITSHGNVFVKKND